MSRKILEVDSYIQNSESNTRIRLLKLRELIIHAHPDIEEHWAYGMPAYKLNKKPLVYFAAFKNHIGFYGTPTGHEAFSAKFASYKQGKGSVQFPLNQEIPFALIQKIVEFRVQEILQSKK
jgi:uncharacterized protein YdhG (YjbR/CyaY superfamily)